MRILLIVLAGLFAGCLPDISDECGPQAPCASGQCIGGVCVPSALDLDVADQAVVDARLIDAAIPDGRVDDACVPTVEQCNGVDDDCDARIDEGPGGVLSRPCYPADSNTRGVGQCLEGVSVCRDGAFGDCEDVTVPQVEFCNGLDDDCDGGTDEASGEVCYSGPAGTVDVGQCRAGRRRCVAAVASPECLDQVLPALEICDGVDGDCDGRIDEGLDCACAPGDRRPCHAAGGEAEGIGRCRGGEQQCAGQRWGACRGAVLPGAEQCNAEDDDCDGAVDEGLDGAPCRVGLGRCASEGELRCTADGLRCDAPVAPPEREVCNGLDDDCDGRTDEGYNRGAPCQTGVGPCAAEGFVVCAADGTAACRADPLLPAEERCNAVDDDCDGRVDEGAVVRCYPGPDGTAGRGTCRAGEQACVNGAASGNCRGAVEPVAEICDGRDRDCDGLVDEGAALCGCAPGEERACFAGPPESAGRGRCRAGAQRCGDGGAWDACEGEIGPQPEQCDGVDDDCDGRVDERAADTGRACVRGVGACAVEGRRACVDGGIVCDAEPAVPRAEICNGVDDDCDGVTDEGIDGVDAPCRLGQGACETDGRTVCRAAEGVVCGGEPIPPTPETCNAVDDDCDGVVDEGARNACGECGPPPPPDRCDGVDGDCDGRVDEAPDPLVGTNCVQGEGRCARDGRFSCGPGGLVCVSGADIGEPELCNGDDDDCDGRVDEETRCVLAAADARCVDGACRVDRCADGFFDDDQAPENGCERGCEALGAGRLLGEAAAIGIAAAEGQIATAWATADTVWLQIDAAAPRAQRAPSAVERPRPVYDGARWRVIGRMRLDDRQRAVRFDFDEERIEVLPGVAAGTPDGRYGGAQDATAWLALPDTDAEQHSLYVTTADAPPVVAPLGALPHPTAGPAIIGRIDDVLRVVVPLRLGEQTRLQVLSISPDGTVVDVEGPAVGPIVGRLSVARTGREALIAYAGDGAVRLHRLTYAADGAQLTPLDPLRAAGGVSAVALTRTPGGLLGVSAGRDGCRIHLFRADGAALPDALELPDCVAASVANGIDGPVLGWIDGMGDGNRGVPGCR